MSATTKALERIVRSEDDHVIGTEELPQESKRGLHGLLLGLEVEERA